jgi:alkanesulfonate monooxygenase SsuD/methylene tetrahydromethanopterin reductase-like flavin-dependent oxidoreductase (luciferase family)
LKLGITPWSRNILNAQRLSRQAQLAESLGYDSFWVPEGHFQARQQYASPLILLAACAAATSRITLATTSLLLTLRNPWLVAEETATLDQLSNGRLIVGVGRGFDREMLETFDVINSEKRAVFEKRLKQIISAWRGEPIPPHNKQLSPLPVQQPYPPIWASAFGPKALAQSGQLGLPYLASPFASEQTLRDNFDIHNEALAAGGNSNCQLRAAMRVVFISNDEGLCDSLRARIERRYDGSSEELLIGRKEAVAEQLQALGERIGINYVVATTMTLPTIEQAAFEESAAALVDIADGL